jgi:hypothetical protein
VPRCGTLNDPAHPQLRTTALRGERPKSEACRALQLARAIAWADFAG